VTRRTRGRVTGFFISVRAVAKRSVYSVLRQKEEQLCRLRREVEALKALVLVISIRGDHEMPSTGPTRIELGMADLQMYFPFVRNLQSVRYTCPPEMLGNWTNR
jgi:hypothetical protein